MSSKEIRQKFIDFFESKGHKMIEPSSLISDDPTVLFTSAGMQQFKRFYTNPSQAPTPRIVTIQPCVRTSDIEEVGDESHLTFFEMLGNFSFGDPASPAGGYAKKEAIGWGIEFLTEVLKINKNRLSYSVFSGDPKNHLPEDKESFEVLKNLGVSPASAKASAGKPALIKKLGKEDNFWGPTGSEGPCGPTVEIYIDSPRGEVGGVEVWNLVFNEYYCKDGQPACNALRSNAGRYTPLSSMGVDTGMGLERLAAVLAGGTDIYKTDLFLPIIEEINSKPQLKVKNLEKQTRIIADHIKAATFLLSDGILPSNKEQGYVLRRLIRRAIVKGRQLGFQESFCKLLASKIIEIYQGVYPLVGENITAELDKEETKFGQVLGQGLKEFEKVKNNLSGEVAFKLYETYGFPVEMTEELAKEQGIKIDKKELEGAFKKHQEISRAGLEKKFKGGLVDESPETIKLHTAAHLLLESLRRVLGDHVVQKGSNINPERLRFDFSQPEKLTEEQIKKVEDLVNEQIKKGLPVTMEEMSVDEAKKSGAQGVFDERYGEKVKVYSIGDFSKEICGGPHVQNTRELGQFKIIKEESSSAGIRRIKAALKNEHRLARER